MSKREKKKPLPSPPRRGARPSLQPHAERQQALQRAEKLISEGQAREAIDLLEPLLARYPRVADVHHLFGYACVVYGDVWTGLAAYEQAAQLSRHPIHWLPLAWLYLDLELNVHALQAFRQALRRGVDAPELDDVQKVMAHLEDRIRETAEDLDLSVPQVERGLRSLELGGRALQAGDYAASVAANRLAIKLLPGWPPPHNNLALGLFFEGKPQEAMAITRQVLSQHPTNLQALANSIRFLTWSGQEEEARALWPRLQAIEPEVASDRLKLAEAAAILNQDEFVWQVLRPLDRADAAELVTPDLRQQAQILLAIAEANLRKPAARRRLKALQPKLPLAKRVLAALQAGKPGLGWGNRFPYFSVAELIPWQQMEKILELMGREDQLPEQRFREQMARLTERFPQLTLVGEKLLWEEEQAEVAITLLEVVATPAAYAALRRFGLGQAGDDDARMQALFALAEAGQIEPNEKLRVWQKGEWQEIELQQYEISEERTWDYAPEVMELLDQGMEAFQQDDLVQAEQLLQRVLELDPGVKEAYHNLGVFYSRRGEIERARELYQSALELDPLYVFPRCSLALFLLDEDDVEGAMAMLQPLASVTRFHPQEMAFYSYAQARVFIRQEEYERARNVLTAALEIWPDHELAQELLGRLDLITRMKTGFESFFEQRRRREQAKRARLQTQLTTADPPLAEALSPYTKEVLTGMGRVVLPWGGWSALRKAELRDRILDELGDPDNLERIVQRLNDTERAALRQVLDHGGHLPWSDFDAGYGNDLEESPYWQWHVPETTMGRLRHRGLLVEATVDRELLIVVPLELRPVLDQMLSA